MSYWDSIDRTEKDIFSTILNTIHKNTWEYGSTSRKKRIDKVISFYQRELEYNCKWLQIGLKGLLHWGSYIRGNLCPIRYRQSRCDYTYYEIDCRKCQNYQTKKLRLKKLSKLARISVYFLCTSFFFSISAWILMNASFFLYDCFQPKALFEQWTN